jgi:hypothetical protein
MTTDTTSFPLSSLERIQHAEELLASCTDTTTITEQWVPVWSNYYLERLVAKILGKQGAELNDLFRGFWNLLGHTRVPLTTRVAYFQRSVCFVVFGSLRFHPVLTQTAGYISFMYQPYTRFPDPRVLHHRSLIEQLDFTWMVSEIKEGCTPAQAYLTLSVLNEEQLSTCKAEILEALKDSEYLEHALHTEGIRSPDTLPYGNYQIERIEVQSIEADVVCYSLEGVWLGVIMHEVREGKAEQWVKAFYPRIPAPSDWQTLIQKRLDDKE